jgi:hypothetical protein
VNNFCVFPATVAFIRRALDKSIKDRAFTYLQISSTPVLPKVLLQVLASEHHQAERVPLRGKILLRLTISLKAASITTKGTPS